MPLRGAISSESTIRRAITPKGGNKKRKFDEIREEVLLSDKSKRRRDEQRSLEAAVANSRSAATARYTVSFLASGGCLAAAAGALLPELMIASNPPLAAVCGAVALGTFISGWNAGAEAADAKQTLEAVSSKLDDPAFIFEMLELFDNDPQVRLLSRSPMLECDHLPPPWKQPVARAPMDSSAHTGTNS